LGDLLSVLLAPYDDMGAFKGRIRVAVERMGVGEAAATGLALVIHELATNSMKYGALLVPTGTLDLSTSPDGTDIVMTWLERGGPPSWPRKPGRKVSAASLSDAALLANSCGSIAYDWSEGGLIVSLRTDRERLSS
jgi:two-component sensor histidine kinase